MVFEDLLLIDFFKNVVHLVLPVGEHVLGGTYTGDALHASLVADVVSAVVRNCYYLAPVICLLMPIRELFKIKPFFIGLALVSVFFV